MSRKKYFFLDKSIFFYYSAHMFIVFEHLFIYEFN